MPDRRDMRPVKLILTIDDVLELLGALDSACQEFCTGDCNCHKLDEKVRTWLPPCCDHREEDQRFVCVLPTGHPGGHQIGILTSAEGRASSQR